MSTSSRKVLLVVILVSLCIEGLHSFSFSDLLWFGSSSSSKRGARQEFEIAQSEYGECDWFDPSSAVVSTSDMDGQIGIGIGSAGSPGRTGKSPMTGKYRGRVQFRQEFGAGESEIGNVYDLTAAHRTLPIGSYATVTNDDNGRSVVVRIVDRGPYVDGRISTLSAAAFHQIADLDKGVIPCLVSIK